MGFHYWIQYQSLLTVEKGHGKLPKKLQLNLYCVIYNSSLRLNLKAEINNLTKEGSEKTVKKLVSIFQ